MFNSLSARRTDRLGAAPPAQPDPLGCRCYPYTYSDLQRHLAELQAQPLRAARMQRSVLARTLAGNAVDLLSVSSAPGEHGSGSKGRGRRAVVISARVHPGESNASLMMQGVVDYLTGPSPIAQLLRDTHALLLVPVRPPPPPESGRGTPAPRAPNNPRGVRRC